MYPILFPKEAIWVGLCVLNVCGPYKVNLCLPKVFLFLAILGTIVDQPMQGTWNFAHIQFYSFCLWTDFGQTKKKTLHYCIRAGGLYPVVNPIFLSLCKSSLKALSLFFCLQSETLIAELRRQETLGHGGYCFSTKMSENWPLKSIFQNNIFYEVGPWDMYVYFRRKESENSNNDTFLWWFETLCYLMHLQIRVQLSVSRIIL